MYLQRTQKSAKTSFFHFHFMFFALFLQKTPLVFSRSSLAHFSLSLGGERDIIGGYKQRLGKSKMETETEAKMLTILHKTMKNEDFLHFL